MKQPTRNTTPYATLATKIVEGRNALGITQAAFAAELGFKQQSISRWEAGTHRPTVAQIPALAKLIKDEVATLMQLAGYGTPVTASLSTLFPVDALPPEAFETFVADLVHALEPTAEVRVQGSRGHAQKGTDVVARFQDGRQWSFQCKRVGRFGPNDVQKVIDEHKIDAERKFLVLSRIASPDAAEAVQAHPDWTLWDKQDLSRKIRSLPIESQERLVDTYFRGQRMALLGRCEPGPWLTLEEYLAPFRGRGAVLSHDWSLVGREGEIAKIVEALEHGDMRFALLIGPGGIGKTRILKEGIQRFAAKRTGTTIRFLSTAREPDAASLEALGTGRKILVVDDAHDRDGIKLLIEYACRDANTRLVMATRPYAEQRIRNDLGLYGISSPLEVRLGRLGKQELHRLVVEVLEEANGNPDRANAVVAMAADNPLVAAMAARVVAREGIIPELARGTQELRHLILARFTDVITGNLGGPADTPLLRSALELLALIQPFHMDDHRITELVQKARPGTPATEVTRALKILKTGGVLYRRGQLYRLMPDLLGDFLIEESCIGTDGRLTQFAMDVADAVDGPRLTQVLVNLGRMDWRRADGALSESDLLEPLWRKLNTVESDYDPRIKAVEAVSFYQPRQALDFVQAQIDRGRTFHELTAILRRVAFSPEYRREALGLLWELGRNDNRNLSQNPGHPIRTLNDLMDYSRDKPLAFVEDVAEFGFGLFQRPDVWSGAYTPLDVVAPLLGTEGMTTTSTGRGISMEPFFVTHRTVAHLRERVIEQVLSLLRDDDPKIAHLAATFLSNALRAPMGLLNTVPDNELRGQYEAEFSRTIDKIGPLIAGGTLAPTTVIGLVGSLGWFAEYDEGTLGNQVRNIFTSLPHDLDFRFLAALVVGADRGFVGQVRFDDWSDDREWLDDLVPELLAAYPDRTRLCSAFLAHRQTLEAAGISTFPGIQLVFRLVTADPAIGRVIITRSLSDPHTLLRDYLGIAAGALYENSPEEGRTLIARMLRSPDPMIQAGGVRGLIGVRRQPDTADIGLLRDALAARVPAVAALALTALGSWRELDDRERTQLALAVAFDREPDLIEAIGSLFCTRTSALLGALRDEDVHSLLDRMNTLPSLDGYWVSELLIRLARTHGLLVAQFLLARCETELSDKAPKGFSAISHTLRHRHLALNESSAIGTILDRVWLWLRRHDEATGWSRYQIGQMFAAMFKIDSMPVVEFFTSILDRATTGDLRWIGDILRHSHHRFAFENRAFVERYLHQCKTGEAKLVDDGVDNLLAAAVSGGWSGIRGEPMPRDIQARDEARTVLATLSRLSPAYRLYRAILEHAERNIDRSIAEGKALDEDE